MYSAWGHLASLPEIRLEWRPLVGRVGQYLHATKTITLDPRMCRRQARSVLAHELAHFEAADVFTHCANLERKQERSANSVAARRLILLEPLGDALVLHEQHLSAAAVELRVSDALLRHRLTYLHPSERHWLTRRLEGVI